MNHRTGLDRGQTLLFPERLEDYVAAENPVRFLDAFVGSLDLHALGFGKARCARSRRERTGRLSFAGHPPAGGRQKRGDFLGIVTPGVARGYYLSPRWGCEVA